MSKTKRPSLGARVLRHEIDTFLDTCIAVNTPRAQACFMMAIAGEWRQYLDLTMPDTELDTFADDYLVTEMMRKNPLIDTGIDTKTVATDKWRCSEDACRVTNSVLREYIKGNFSFPRDVNSVLVRAQSIIANTLGTLTRAKIEFAEQNFRFGPGATSAARGADVLPSRKMTCDMHVSSRLYPYARTLLGTIWGAEVTNISLRDYNEVEFVPKDAKTDRAIAVEPHMNIFVQLGQGALLRKMLRRAGINLDRQADVNRALVRLAASKGLCTIDLSSASDTIAEQLIWLLLPYDWAAFLNLSRVDYSVVDGEEVRLEKFSSMGNGFTFELETLIFWALAKSVDSNVVAVFGDDIIVERQCSSLLIRALNSLGFSVNTRKTFLTGSFFESCGTDVWRGVDVRPCYFKGKYHDTTSAVIRIANKIRRYAHRRNNGFGCDARFNAPYRSLISRDRRASRTCISANAGDDGLVINFDEATNAKRAKHGLQGYFGVSWRASPIQSLKTDIKGAYLCALAWGSPEIARTNEPVRGRMGISALSRQLIFDWQDLGPWI